ncbi:MAG: hypothetical protein K2P17_01450 [Helicobacteraceae bacterium]|nr:hypothetical protein [Helicobacteraceae bacterium]
MGNNIFDILLKIFDKLFNNIENLIFYQANSIFLNGFITAILTLVIIFWAFKKIKEGDFQFPRDVIDLVMFLLLTIFISYSLSNKAFLDEITSYLDIPVNMLQNFIFQIINANGENITIGDHLENILYNIFDNYYVFIPDGISLLNIGPNLIISLLLWLVYAWFSFILVASIIITFILNYLQIAFWKSFAVLMLPLLYFKVTIGAVIFWLKTIIALTLISTFMLIIGGLSNQVEKALTGIMSIVNDSNDRKVSYLLLCSFIIAKIICITFLKEIPSMINGMLQTNASASAGNFANSVAMTSIGAGAAASAYGAFRTAMSGSKLGENIGVGLGKTAMQTPLGSKIANNIQDTASVVTSSQLSSSVINIGGNIKRGIGNITTGKSWQTNNNQPKSN